MSVKKSNRGRSPVAYMDHAYRVEENVIKYVLSDFGTTRSYRDLRTFFNRAKMSDEDKELFEKMAEKYHITVEASYPEYIFDYFRKCILETCRDLISLISKAHGMYPNSVYEFNVRRQYQTDAINACYDMKHMLQIAINLFKSNHLEKFVPLINDIDKEIEYLKMWRKDSNKLKKACYDNDERYKVASMKRVEKEMEKQQMRDDIFLARILHISNIRYDQLRNNMSTAVVTMDEFGRPRSNCIMPAIWYETPDGKIKNFGIC